MSALGSEGSGGSDMEKDDGGRAGVEALRSRDKILCYINMQSPGRRTAHEPGLHDPSKSCRRSSDCVLARF